MKHLCSILATCLFTAAFAQNGQLPNPGFEYWTTSTLYDYPTDWESSNQQEFYGIPMLTQSSDAQLGSKSVELHTAVVGDWNDTVFGYVFQGTIGQMGPEGGVPYTSTFNTVKFYYKCDIPAGDSLYVLVMRFSSGVMTEMQVLPAATGQVNSWTQATVSLAANTQDELFFGFVMGDPINENYCAPGAWARIDNVQLYNGANAQTALPDYSFENWSSVSVESPDDWYTYNEMLAGMGLENVNKTADANSGMYAAEMTTVQEPVYGDTIPAMLSLTSFDSQTSMIPYNASPSTFSGAYKYAPVNGDQAFIMITFYNNGNVIGFQQQLIAAAATYTTFSSPLTIVGTPDSIAFFAHSGSNPGSVLKLDDLSLSGGNVSVDEFAKSPLSVYPNPASVEVMVKAEGIYDLELINAQGTVVYTARHNSGVTVVDLLSFPSGTYFVRLQNADQIVTEKLILR